MLRGAIDDDGVEPGKFELGGPEAAGLRIADSAGEGGFGDGRDAALSGHGGAGDNANCQSQCIVRPQGIGMRRRMFEHVMHTHRAAAHIEAVKFLRRFFDLQLTAGQVDVQYASLPTMRFGIWDLGFRIWGVVIRNPQSEIRNFRAAC
jgi:hypothetical protein